MSVKVRLPSLPRQLTKGQEVVEVTGNNVMECLDNLTAQFPDLRRWLFNKQGEVANHVRIFINKEQVSNTELVQDGDELWILIAVAGG